MTADDQQLVHGIRREYSMASISRPLGAMSLAHLAGGLQLDATLAGRIEAAVSAAGGAARCRAV